MDLFEAIRTLSRPVTTLRDCLLNPELRKNVMEASEECDAFRKLYTLCFLPLSVQKGMRSIVCMDRLAYVQRSSASLTQEIRGAVKMLKDVRKKLDGDMEAVLLNCVFLRMVGSKEHLKLVGWMEDFWLGWYTSNLKVKLDKVPERERWIAENQQKIMEIVIPIPAFLVQTPEEISAEEAQYEWEVECSYVGNWGDCTDDDESNKDSGEEDL